ncbi:LacI family DNA-binding transcriptional regulator [Moheibacter lacus]|uniref:LacI family DNA-binding transcriptional regulator n=1 Tax=Moheibacter lacus TaxID=2745851 RepID=A0A838ZIN5_9FLAO|nr:LacI family DNA-binding transcriptional regulator [Moheibacter lacus]MBA5629118.1 LacI family DNA-binding transcriptional regulator [Moheibacter lacus]
MKKNVTLKQIAKELGVSVSTVSKSLRDNEEIGLETRQKIQAFAKMYNYKPNSIALNLRNKSTNSIAIILPQIVNHFFTNVVQGIESEANRRNYNVIIAVSNDSFEKEVLNMETLVNGSIDGFILSVAKETMKRGDYHHFNETISQGVPIVMFDREVQEVNCDKVVIDDVQGAKEATQKLLKTGCKRIVFITTEDFVSVGNLRLKGYKEALIESQIEIDDALIIKVKDQFSSDEIEKFIFQELEKLIQIYPDVDGLIGVNEFYTITAANYFKKKGSKIPGEVSIIAFSDGDLPKYSYPSLTAVRQHGREMGEAAAKLLLDKLEGITPEEEYQTIVIETELKERESTK